MNAQEPVKRPRVKPWKIVAVLAALVLLTPVWIAYGCLGTLLTRPSGTTARTGLQLLTALGLWLVLQASLANSEGENGGLRTELEIGGWLAALLLVQWKLDQLIVFHLSQKPEERRVDVAGIGMLGVFAAAAGVMWKPSVAALSQWQILLSYSMCTCWLPPNPGCRG
jgi:hypothetical protein